MKSFSMLLLLVALSFAAVPARTGQRSPGSELREVHGSVVDKEERSIAAAVIYLKNMRTLTVKTYISDDKGQYRFSGLDPNVDYELHAEHDDQTSSNRTISSFDSRKEIVFTLKVDKDKKKNEK